MAVSSKIKQREIVADERAVNIIDEYVKEFMEHKEVLCRC